MENLHPMEEVLGKGKNIWTIKGAFDIHTGDMISFVGAGGKTTLMFAMAGEIVAPDGLVITTCTTKIYPPSESDTPNIFLSPDANEIIEFIQKKGNDLRHVTIASEKMAASGKLKGVHPDVIARLHNLGPVRYILVEADGAAQRPLKAPDTRFEPVIPPHSSLVIPVVGIDALGCKLDDRAVFRSAIAANLTGTRYGEAVSLDTMTILITHPLGIIHGSPPHARIVPFINKTDMEQGLSKARRLASRILEEGHPQIDRVVLGQARFLPSITDVITF